MEASNPSILFPRGTAQKTVKQNRRRTAMITLTFITAYRAPDASGLWAHTVPQLRLKEGVLQRVRKLRLSALWRFLQSSRAEGGQAGGHQQSPRCPASWSPPASQGEALGVGLACPVSPEHGLGICLTATQPHTFRASFAQVMASGTLVLQGENRSSENKGSTF